MATTSEHTDVTVVITCFQYGRFLEEAVGSALEQTGGAPHVIVVDDGSTETHTLEVLTRLPPNVDLLRQSNQGLAAARNAGLRRALTPLLIVLDADDRLAPGALRALRRPLEQDDRLGFTYGLTRFFGDWDAIMTMPPYDPYRLLYRHTIGSTCLMRRRVFEEVGGFDPAFRRYEDWDFWLGALGHGWHGRQVPEVTFLYRRHGRTMVHDARAGYRTWFRRLRTKHASLYARRSELAGQSDLGVPGRLAYRFFWGPRPLPARVEHALQHALFAPRTGSSG